MKSILARIILLSLAFGVMGTPSLLPATEHNQSAKIDWVTDYDKALEESQKTSLPIVLFFTGSDWCGWCTKIEEEVFNTTDFIQATKGKYIFVKIDFPLYTPLDPKTTAKNKQLQQKYAIKGFPTLILIDGNQNQIGTSSYQPGGGKFFAGHLKTIVDDYSENKASSANNVR